MIHMNRKQLSIVSAFTITTYKAQGLTMRKIVVDLHLQPTTSQVASTRVSLSQIKGAEDLAILRPFDRKVLRIHSALAQNVELARLDEHARKHKKSVLISVF